MFAFIESICNKVTEFCHKAYKKVGEFVDKIFSGSFLAATSKFSSVVGIGLIIGTLLPSTILCGIVMFGIGILGLGSIREAELDNIKRLQKREERAAAKQNPSPATGGQS